MYTVCLVYCIEFHSNFDYYYLDSSYFCVNFFLKFNIFCIKLLKINLQTIFFLERNAFYTKCINLIS